ncbi:MAG: hypothetical protein G01um10142_551 [Parcubacteria group bacterium Gr01-1014_2]|nr:MAG: hypothetical protein G01um10142_551 [Parcubacteria group bacterium Gr01-1014_2]
MADSHGASFISFFYNYYSWAKYASGPIYLYNFLMRYFSRLWENWKRFGFFIGNLTSNVFLTIFYFTIFALFAIPYKLITYYKKSSGSNFKLPRKQMRTFEDFQKEF